MGNLINDINQALAESETDVLIEQQIGRLGTIGIDFSTFTTEGVDQIEDLADDLKNIPFPESLKLSEFKAFLKALEEAFPEEIPGFQVVLDEQGKELEAWVYENITVPFQDVIELYNCTEALLVDLGVLTPEADALGAQQAVVFGNVGELLDGLSTSLTDLKESIAGIEIPEGAGNKIGVAGLVALAGVVIAHVPRKYFTNVAINEYAESVQLLTDNSKLAENVETVVDFIEAKLALPEGEIRTTWNNFVDISISNYEDNDPTPELASLIAEMDQLAYVLSSEPESTPVEIDNLVNSLSGNSDELKAKLGVIHTAIFDNVDVDLTAFYAAIDNQLEELEDEFLELFSTVKSTNIVDISSHLPTIASSEWNNFLDDFELDITNGLSNASNGINAFFSQLNLTGLQATVNNTRTKLTTDLNNLKTTIGNWLNTFITDLFNAVALSVSLNSATLTSDINLTINSYETAINNRIGQVKNGITTTLDQFSATVLSASTTYTHQDLENAINGLVQNLSGLLITQLSKIDQLRKKIVKAEKAIQDYSFKQVSNQVVGEINKATDKLKKVNRDTMNAKVRLAITLAIEAIPSKEKLDEELEKILLELDELVKDGPVALLTKIKDKPQELIDKLIDSLPLNLIEEKLEAAHKELIKVVNQLDSTKITDPLKKELALVDQQLGEIENPCKIIDELIEPYDRLKQVFAGDSPVEKWKTEIDQATEDLAAKVKDALPFDKIDEVSQTLKALFAEADNFVIGSLEELRGDLNIKLSELPEPNEIDTFLNTQIAEITSLYSGSFTLISDLRYNLLSQSGLKAKLATNELDLALNTGIYSLLSPFFKGTPQSDSTSILYYGDLQDLLSNGDELPPRDENNPANFLEYIQAYSALKQIAKNTTLPNEQQINVDLLLDKLNPNNYDFSVHLKEMGELLRFLDQKILQFTNWKKLAKPCIDELINCLEYNVAAPLECLRETLSPFLKQLLELVVRFKRILRDNGPADNFISSLPDIDALANVTEDIRATIQAISQPDFYNVSNLIFNTDPNNPNYQTLEEEIEDQWDALKDALDSFDLQQIKSTTCDSFDSMRNNLKPSTVISSAFLDNLDNSHKSILKLAEAFDPLKWINNSLAPTANAILLPYIEPFDLSKQLNALLAKTEKLKEELREELKRVYEEFLQLLSAVPTFFN